jgi:hypothetical protein
MNDVGQGVFLLHRVHSVPVIHVCSGCRGHKAEPFTEWLIFIRACTSVATLPCCSKCLAADSALLNTFLILSNGVVVGFNARKAQGSTLPFAAKPTSTRWRGFGTCSAHCYMPQLQAGGHLVISPVHG